MINQKKDQFTINKGWIKKETWLVIIKKVNKDSLNKKRQKRKKKDMDIWW